MLLFISTYLLTLPALIIILFLGIIFEANDNNFSIFLGSSAATIAFFMYDIQLVTIGISISAYAIIGIVWSFWRYKRYADNTVEAFIASNSTNEIDKKYMLARIDPKNMLSRIVSWIIIWPFSMIENVTGDIIRLIRTLVSETFKSVYNKIYDNAAAKIPHPTPTQGK